MAPGGAVAEVPEAAGATAEAKDEPAAAEVAGTVVPGSDLSKAPGTPSVSAEGSQQSKVESCKS